MYTGDFADVKAVFRTSEQKLRALTVLNGAKVGGSSIELMYSPSLRNVRKDIGFRLDCPFNVSLAKVLDLIKTDVGDDFLLIVHKKCLKGLIILMCFVLVYCLVC